MNDNVAKIAEEQEMVFSDFHKKYANDPQVHHWFIELYRKQESYLIHQLKQKTHYRDHHPIPELNVPKAQWKQELDELQNEIMNISSDLPQVSDNITVSCIATACCHIIWN